MAAHTAEKKGTFLEEVIEATPGGERLVHCLQCGSCGGSCPSGADMEYTPRDAVRHDQRRRARAVLAANTMWACVSCYFCTTRCPQEHPHYRHHVRPEADGDRRAALPRTPTPRRWPRPSPIWWTSTGGASKFGLATLLSPVATGRWRMMKMGPMGMQMFSRGRMALLPTKIRQIDQLQAIIKQSQGT